MLENKYECVIKKSKFIAYLYQIKTKEDITFIIDDLKQEHKKAVHFPYAFILDNTAGKSDDKEPHNTAGIQIYNQLQINDLKSHLMVIVRYYGGTKLGASNLLRTYLNCAKNCIKKEYL